MKLNIAVLYGSVRTDRQGIKVARFITSKLKERGHEATLIDPKEYPLPELDYMYKEYDPGKAPEAMEKVHKILDEADAFLIVSAEYNHSIPSTLKNLLDTYQTEYLYKPSGIVTYSAGPFGGVRAAMALRAILAELGMPSVPSTFPVSDIYKSFDDKGIPVDKAYERRVVKFLDEFEWYAQTLKEGRGKGLP